MVLSGRDLVFSKNWVFRHFLIYSLLPIKLKKICECGQTQIKKGNGKNGIDFPFPGAFKAF
jgi:hypothetical protein